MCKLLAPLWMFLFCLPPVFAEEKSLQQKAAKNVVMIVADDLGRTLGCYGDRLAQTPHLDALAKRGTRFDFAFCTTASCSPSRSVILSGLHNHTNGQYGLAHADHHFVGFDFVESLPKLLKTAGYRTCSIGKMHVLPEKNFAFDEYLNAGIQGGRNPVRMAENAEEFFRKTGDQPFFLYFCPTDPHRAQKGFANEQLHPGVTEVQYDPAKIEVPPFLPDTTGVREELAEYYQAASRVDTGVGRLVEALQKTGQLERTLILFLSDNGIPFPGAKTTLYEPGIRLPLIISSPEQSQRGVVSKALVSWVDLVPTVLEYTAAKGPSYSLPGRSLLNILDEEQPEGFEEIYASHSFHEVTMYYPMRSLRTRRYKYILNLASELSFPFASDLHGSVAWQETLNSQRETYGNRSVRAYLHRAKHELYDLEEDPHELHNLSDMPEHQELLKQLQSKLQTFQAGTKDPWLIKYEHE